METPPLSMQLPLPFLDDEEAARLQQEVEGRRLKLLNLEWTPERLSRDCLLLPADRAEIATCRGAQNRLGFALHLLLLRYLHFSLPSLDLVPEAVVRFVALQVRVDSEALALYGRQAQTQDDHIAQIRRYLEVRAYTATDSTRLYQVRLTDLLIEVDDWVDMRSHFTHLHGRGSDTSEARDPVQDVCLFAVLLALGTNLPLAAMADAADLDHLSEVYWPAEGATGRRVCR